MIACLSLKDALSTLRTMAIALKALIFDYGNVLCLPQERADVQSMASIFGLGADEYAPLYWRDRYPYDAGKLDAFDYWQGVADQARRTLTAGEIEELRRIDIVSWCNPSVKMVDFARGVRAGGVRTALLSNMPMDLRTYLTSEVPWLPEFDHLTFSCDVKMVKPGAGIYRHCLAGLGVEPEEALFLDDRPDNVEAAHALGIHAIVFTTPCDAAAALDGRFDLPARIES